MPKFILEMGYRITSGTPALSMFPTHNVQIEVEALNEFEARTKAIERVYEVVPDCEHVRPMYCMLVRQRDA